jgi:hypothetical protein
VSCVVYSEWGRGDTPSAEVSPMQDMWGWYRAPGIPAMGLVILLRYSAATEDEVGER